MNTRMIMAMATCLTVVACSEDPAPVADDATSNAMTDSNPILEEWTTPFGVPPFDRIAAEDYLPAIRAGMQEQNREIEAIVTNTEAPTFENTVEALELSGTLLSRANRIFNAVDSAHSNDVLKETGKTVAPELSAHRDSIQGIADFMSDG